MPIDLSPLRGQFQGVLTTPKDPSYERERVLFNTRIRRRPAVLQSDRAARFRLAGGPHLTKTSEARPVVVISSTARDLPEHRKEVEDACLRQGMFPSMMEHLPASDADATTNAVGRRKPTPVWATPPGGSITVAVSR